jgi:peptidyl-tRNA hydrolase, PTH1 family
MWKLSHRFPKGKTMTASSSAVRINIHRYPPPLSTHYLYMQTIPIQIIAGLGNPGREYEQTRHNAGFWLLDQLAQSCGGTWRMDKNYHAEIAKIMIAGRSVWLMKPQTFMNRSGHAVVPFMRFYRLAPESLLVAHDELDILPGEVRIKQGGGNGGHNGLKDIQAQLGTPNFWRLRLGIGHPRSIHSKQEVADFVLSRATIAQQAAMDTAQDECLKHLPALIPADKHSLEHALRSLHSLKAMTIVNPNNVVA